MQRPEPTDDELQGAVRELQNALFYLASEAGDQAERLRQFPGTSNVDELVMELEDWYQPGQVWEFHRLLSADQMAALATLDAQIELIRHDPQYVWDETDFLRPGWHAIRIRAREALASMGIQWGGLSYMGA